jgi:hypothetical protein
MFRNPIERVPREHALAEELVAQLECVENLGLDRATARLAARQLGVVVGIFSHTLKADVRVLGQVAHHLRGRLEVGA